MGRAGERHIAIGIIMMMAVMTSPQRQQLCAQVERLVDADLLHKGLVVGYEHQTALERAQRCGQGRQMSRITKKLRCSHMHTYKHNGLVCVM